MDPHSSYPPPAAKKTSPWVYVGCACGVLVLLALGGIVATTWFGYRAAKNFAEGVADPVKRAERAREVLPYDTLPPGYEPLGALSIPFLVDLAFFSTERLEDTGAAEPEAGATEPAATGTEPAAPDGTEPASTEPAGTEPPAADTAGSESPSRVTTDDVDLEFGERGLVYVVMKRLGGERAELDRYLRGEGPAPDWMGQGNVNVESEEVIRNGRLEAGGAQLVYTARRGEVTTQGDRRDGLFNLFLADCPGDKKARVGIWFAPDPAAGRPVAEVDWTGTPADPAALQSFAGHFRFCEGPK